MKTIFVPQRDFDLPNLQRKHKGEQVLVRVQAPDGKTLDINMAPSGVTVTVAEFREVCETSANKTLATQKLESIKILGDNVELSIPGDQMQALINPPADLLE